MPYKIREDNNSALILHLHPLAHEHVHMRTQTFLIEAHDSQVMFMVRTNVFVREHGEKANMR